MLKLNRMRTIWSSTPRPRARNQSAGAFEFEVDRLRGREFLRLMREVRSIHRRNGAFSWRLDEDLTRSTATARAADKGGTGYDQQSLARLHVGEDVPEERYYLIISA
jgi:hypothetical protein